MVRWQVFPGRNSTILHHNCIAISLVTFWESFDYRHTFRVYSPEKLGGNPREGDETHQRGLSVPGKLYIVSTPIGNLQDITLRALAVLRQVDFICAEDTRTTGRLLQHFEITTPMVSFYSYNQRRRIPGIIKRLLGGESAALVSEAGTPGISDPGYLLIRAAIDAGVPVSPIPGAVAFVAAVVASGLPTHRIVFEGFLPKKKGRLKKMRQLAEENGTVVIYESPHRILKTLEEIVNIFGNRYIVLAREITKKFEEFIRGSAEEVLQVVRQRNIKGEIVLVIAGKDFQNDIGNQAHE